MSGRLTIRRAVMASIAIGALVGLAPAARGQDAAPRPAPASPARARPAPPRPRPADDGPAVMSAEAAARARGQAPVDGRYDAEPDWRDVPAWRQTSFFGIRARGQVFIYVVDCSGSMADLDRLDRAKSELRRSVSGLRSPQQFKVIFYNDRAWPMPGDLPKSADSAGKAQLSRWLDLVQPDGGTDPRSALSLALAMKPDAVFLLSDGQYPPGTAEAVARSNRGKVPIHCVDLAGGGGGDLRKIARDSGGQYAAR